MGVPERNIVRQVSSAERDRHGRIQSEFLADRPFLALPLGLRNAVVGLGFGTTYKPRASIFGFS
jgi:hypothetical protein